MGWWICLQDPELKHPETEEPLTLSAPDFHAEGGTIVMGGTDKCDVSVTYNYAEHFQFSKLHGLTGRDSISMLEEAIANLGTARNADYWASTKGNAGYMCNVLLGWARQHPNGIWEVD